MTKEEYYKFSEDRKLPFRCPCLSNCARYRFTAYLVGQRYYMCRSNNVESKMKEMGILEENQNISNMLDSGEAVTYIGGNSNFYIYNACPEFFLHSHDHKPSGMGPIATHQFSYDEYYKGSNKFKPGESRHYTECPEYSLFKSKKIKVNVRKKVSFKVRAELQKEVNSKCPFCLNEEVGHFEIHHIDENPSNNEKSNLLSLCPICHSKITKGDITKDEVILKKNLFISVQKNK